MSTEAVRTCKNPGCSNPVPPAKPGHRPPLTCSAACRKAASRAHRREEVQRQAEAARQQRLARWEVFQPTTRSMLSQVEAVGGAVLAEALAEAIWREAAQAHGTADLAVLTRHNGEGAAGGGYQQKR